MSDTLPRFLSRIRTLTRQPSWWAEAAIAMTLTLWAVLSMTNGHALNARHSFALLISIAPECVWERLALAAGLFQFLSLLIAGSSRWLDGHLWRIAACCGSAWFIGFLLINFLSLPGIPPGTAFYGVPLCFDLLAIIKNVRRTA